MIKKYIIIIFIFITFIFVFSQWSIPVRIWQYSLAYFQPNAAHSLISDTLGNVHIIWYDASKDAYDCIKKTMFDDTLWVYTSSFLDDQISSDVDNYYGLSWMPTLSVEPDGKCLAVWEDRRTGSFELYSKYFNGTLWSPQIAVTNNFDSYTWFPKLYYSNSRHNLVFMDDSTHYFNIYYTYFDTMFQTKENITDTNKNCISPDIYSYPDGEISVIFTMESNGNQALYNVRNSGAGWSEFIEVISMSSNIYYPNLISDGADEFALFTSNLSGISNLFISKFNGSGWNNYEMLSDARSNVYYPAGVMIEGKIRIVYVSDENQYGNLYTILYNPLTKSIEEKTVLASHEHGYIMLPQIAVDSGGDVYVVYIVNDETRVDSFQTNDIWWTRLPNVKTQINEGERPYSIDRTNKGYMITFDDNDYYCVSIMDKAGRKIFKKNNVNRELLITKKDILRNDIYFILIEKENSKYTEKIVWLK